MAHTLRHPASLASARVMAATFPTAAIPAVALLAVLLGAGCGGARAGTGPGVGTGVSPGVVVEARGTPPPPPDVVGTYRRAGLLAHGDPLPFVARVVHLATPFPDTTLVVVTLALPSRSLTFAHSGDSYQAGYEVTLAAERVRMTAVSTTADSITTGGITSDEAVVVSSFRETVRTDESILFQRQLTLVPGAYQLRLTVRDGRSGRAATDTLAMEVPRLGEGSLGTPAPYYESEPRRALSSPPRLLVTPRATLTFGRDTALRVYVEGYGPWGSGADGSWRGGRGIAVVAAVNGEDGTEVWRDSTTLASVPAADAARDHPLGDHPSGDRSLASGSLVLPLARLGMGAATLQLWRVGGSDTVRAPLFVTFGDALPAATFQDMLSYLRFFAAPSRLEALRRAPAHERAAAWTALLDAAGGEDGVSGEQALQRYFARIQVANQRYRDDAGPGWLSDRGMVFTALGDPDLVEEPTRPGPFRQGEVQRWSYRALRLQLDFEDSSGFGRWRLTPASEAAFRAAMARVRA